MRSIPYMYFIIKQSDLHIITKAQSSPLIVIYTRGNFMYHHLGFISIYQPLSYPFRSLANYTGTQTFGSEVRGDGDVLFLNAEVDAHLIVFTSISSFMLNITRSHNGRKGGDIGL